jgi:hemerythrin
MDELNYPITWDTRHNIGIKEIDNQHRHFVSILNRLYMAWLDKKSESEIKYLLTEVNDYVDIHFAYEEDLIGKSGYTDLPKHQEIHKTFKASLQRRIKKYYKDSAEVELFQLLGFLEDWLIGHVRKYDQKYVPQLKLRGIS